MAASLALKTLQGRPVCQPNASPACQLLTRAIARWISTRRRALAPGNVVRKPTASGPGPKANSVARRRGAATAAPTNPSPATRSRPIGPSAPSRGELSSFPARRQACETLRPQVGRWRWGASPFRRATSIRARARFRTNVRESNDIAVVAAAPQVELQAPCGAAAYNFPGTPRSSAGRSSRFRACFRHAILPPMKSPHSTSVSLFDKLGRDGLRYLGALALGPGGRAARAPRATTAAPAPAPSPSVDALLAALSSGAPRLSG